MPELKMKPTYKIFILDEDEFNDLHKYIPEVSKEDLKEGLGFANPKTKEAYIKRSGIKELDDTTIIHEAEELLAKNSEHEDEENIRWKKGGALKDILPVVVGAVLAPFTGGASLIPILGGAATSIGMNQYAQSRHPEQLGEPGNIGSMALQGLTGGLSGLGGAGISGAVAGGIKGGTMAAPGFLSKASGIAKGALGMSPSMVSPEEASMITGAKVGSQFSTPQLLSSLTPAAGLASTINTAVGTTPATTNLLGQAGTQAGTTSPAVGQVAGQTPAVAGATTAAPKTLMEQAKSLATPQNILGAGSLMASTMGTTPTYQTPSSVTDLINKLTSGTGLTSLGQQAQSELSNILKSTPQELIPTESDAYYQAALRRTEDAYADAQKQLDAAYNVAGVYGSGEHLAAKDKLNQQLTNAKTDLYAQTESANQKLALTEKYNAIQQALGVDQNVMNDLLGLTGLDVQVAASMYNANAADVTELRKALGTLGSELLIKGTTGTVSTASKILGQ